MNEFTKNIIVFVCAVVVVIGLFHYIAKVSVYNDAHRDSLMSSCQQNGYSWGDCYNVIHGNNDAFSK